MEKAILTKEQYDRIEKLLEYVLYNPVANGGEKESACEAALSVLRDAKR